MKTQKQIDREIARARKLISSGAWDDPEDSRPDWLRGFADALEWLATAGGSPTLAIERDLQRECKQARKGARAFARSPMGKALAPHLEQYMLDAMVTLPYMQITTVGGSKTASFPKWAKEPVE